ncbi:MAG: chromosome segregation protein SMC, partial [Clostridia bacterium]|nr:chromosome segregation protein SMC [Clostridia bacterium]
IEYKQSEFEKAVEEYNKSVDSISNLDSQIASLRDELLELTVGLEKHSGEARLFEQKITSIKETNDKISAEISQDEILQSSIGEEIEDKKKSLEKSKHVLSELERQIEKANDEYFEIVDRITAGEAASQVSGDEIYDALEKIGDVKSNLAGLSTEKTALEAKQAEQMARQDQIKAAKRDLELQKENLQIESEKIEAEILKSNREKGNLSEELLSVNHSLAITAKELDDDKVEYHTKLSRARVLEEMQEDNEGYIVSVKRLLEQAKTNTGLGGRIVGVVAKLMKVPEKLETAIEMALGSAVQNIVTKNEDDAKFIVEFLKQNRFGRATFLPISAVKERSVPDFVRSKLNAKGVLGIASELVEFAQKNEPVFKHLLGGTVIVDCMDNALDLAKSTSYAVKIVTLDGDVINPAGSISGGSRKENTVSLIGREREIKDILAAIESLKNDIKAKTDKYERLKKRQEELSQKSEEIVAKIHELEVESVKLEDDIENADDQIADLDRENRQLDFNNEAILDRIDAIDRALELASKEESEISNKKTEASESKRQNDSKFDLLRKQREEVYDHLTELKVKSASESAQISSLESQIQKLEDDLSVSVYRMRENKFEFQKNTTAIAELEKHIAESVNKEVYEANMKELEAVRNKLASLDGAKADYQNQMAESDSKKLMLSGELQRANDKKIKEEMNLAKIDSDIEAMQERVWEEYGMTYATAVEAKLTDFDLKEGLIESGKIKKQIAALGYVNVNAIEELKSVQERYDDFAGQRDDLEKAEADLVKIIKELTNEMETKFKSQFEEINVNFQKIFKELFGGGRAELRLAEDENLLECGIDIVAEPPGKKLQSISLLSGGEMALTAVAILFAILKLRPMPFCVLDEIEAALDDANVERFAKYLQKFSSGTQFIVITHRKPTMELADSLYGVTMEEKGVSKMVSVKLSDAVKNSTEGV